MNDSRRRLLLVALFYGVGVVVLVMHLAYTMLGENEAWVRRSYSNRWAFRDVPTKRGPIRDRQGVVLVKDVPTSLLEIHYRTFRRGHPCGLAVHCANLVVQAESPARELGFGVGDVEAAFALFLRLPLEYLEAGTTGVDRARDLRFYASALIASLTDSSRRRVGQDIQQLIEAGRRGPICAALGLDVTRLQGAFDQWLGELTELARVLRANDVDLWAELCRLREERRRDPRRELVARTVHGHLPFGDARAIAVEREWHPGFLVRPWVDRKPVVLDGGNTRWESLVPLLGRVTTAWSDSDDDELRQSTLLEMMPELERMAAADAELPEELRESVTERLRQAMDAHIANHGRIGRYGVEADADARLRGTAGVHWVMRGRQARDIGLWSKFDVTPGDSVELTVDVRLQHLLEHAVDRALTGFAPRTVAAIAIVDPRTGDVLALASRPRPADRQETRRSSPEPVVAWWGPGHIGSLAKPLILLEQLDAERRGRPFRAIRTFEPCRGLEELDPKGGPPGLRRHRLRCDKLHGEAVHDSVVSLGKSCNAFFFQAAEGLGWDGVTRAFERFGLYAGEGGYREAFQAHVPGIPAPQYPNPTWGGRQDIQRRAIGYKIEANVLQIARAYCGLATGRLPDLSLLRRQPSELRFVDLGVHPNDLAVVREGMRYCAESGTAAELDLRDVFCKTGTAEIDRRKRNNAWLAGYVGSGNPRMAFACVVYGTANEQYGAAVAGPMFARFLTEVRADPELAKEFL